MLLWPHLAPGPGRGKEVDRLKGVVAVLRFGSLTGQAGPREYTAVEHRRVVPMLRRDLLLVVLVGSQGKPPRPLRKASVLSLRGRGPFVVWAIHGYRGAQTGRRLYETRSMIVRSLLSRFVSIVFGGVKL